ncbi:MAG: hypothetical protein ACYS5V_04310 [Planctomycetota bacterium]
MKHACGRNAFLAVTLALIPCAVPTPARGQARQTKGGYLCQVRLVSEAEPDMTSVGSILRSITRPGMTDEQKCLAVYRFVHEHRYWYPAARPSELGRPVFDPVLTVNCFAPLICQQDAAVTGAFWAGLGYDVRYWQLRGHTTGEVFYDGKWRNFDATLGRYKRDADGGIADVSVTQRHYKPGISYVEPFDDFEIGHRMDLTLRRGETFTRFWYPLSKEADYWRGGAEGRRADDRKDHSRGLKAIMRRKPYRFDTRGAGLCNGLWEFKPDLANAGWRSAFDRAENVAVVDGDLLSPRLRGKPAEVVWRMRTPYIITGAWLAGDFVTAGGKGMLTAFVSANNGATWRKIGPIQSGQRKYSLRDHVAGRFSYLLKVVMQSAGPEAVGVRSPVFTTVVQANPLSLPALKRGPNTVRIFAGEQLETITIWPNLETGGYRAAVAEEVNIVTAREQIQPAWVHGLCAKEGGRESRLVYRVSAPGEIRQVRWGGRFRAGKGDVNEMYWSADGRTWRRQTLSPTWATRQAQTPNLYPAYWETTRLPDAGKAVFLKYRFLRSQPRSDPADLHLASALRIDADYVPPAVTGGAGVEVTYCWMEGEGDSSAERKHTEIAAPLPHAYTITVGGEAKPLMKWVRMRLAE